MTGPLTLSGDPTSNLQAATKQYVDSNIANAKLKYINKFNLQGTKEITILSQDEADKYTLYYFCAFFVGIYDDTSISCITNDGPLVLFSYQSGHSNTYSTSMIFNNVNGNFCSVYYSSDIEIRTTGRAGKFTGRISTTNVTSGSYVNVYAL